MGGDGGTIATGRKYLRGAKLTEADEVKNVKANQLLRTRFCSYSNDKLEEPIVCDELGNLFNKEAILNALINKSMTIQFAHIRSLKDVKTLKLCKNLNYSILDEKESELPALFSCPITKMEFNGNHPFVAIWSTGYVLSEKALREVGFESLQSEYGPFKSTDVIKLIPLESELPLQIEEMIARRQRRSIEKAEKHASTSASDSTQLNEKTAGKRKSKKEQDDGNDIRHKKALTEVDSGTSKISSTKSISYSNELVKSVTNVVNDQQNSSRVYKSLFHKDKEKDKHDRDLFMSVAGIRYTVN